MNRIFGIGVIASVLLVAGCEEQKPEGTAPVSSAAKVELKDDDLPTAADFDDEAEKQITPANYKSELDNLEKEIGQ